MSIRKHNARFVMSLSDPVIICEYSKIDVCCNHNYHMAPYEWLNWRNLMCLSVQEQTCKIEGNFKWLSERHLVYDFFQHMFSQWHISVVCPDILKKCEFMPFVSFNDKSWLNWLLQKWILEYSQKNPWTHISHCISSNEIFDISRWVTNGFSGPSHATSFKSF